MNQYQYADAHHCRIILNGVTLHTGTAITTIGSNSKSAQMFLVPYAIMERIQVTIFFVQEFVLSGLYVWKARAFLNWRRGRNSRSKAHQSLRLMMIHLILSNIIVLARTLTHLSVSFSPNLFSSSRTEVVTSGLGILQRGCRKYSRHDPPDAPPTVE